MIRFACPGCSATYTASDEKAGKTSTCPKCKTQFAIPGADTAPPPMPVSTSPPPSAATIEIEPCPKCGDKLTVEVADNRGSGGHW